MFLSTYCIPLESTINSITTAKRTGLGLSSSSLPLLKRLKEQNYVDQLALTSGAALSIRNPPENLLIDSAAELFRKNWQPGGIFIVVGAIGAVVRLVAPLIENKEKDPAIIVMDANSKNIIPLLGAHISGAEQMTLELAQYFEGNAVLTGNSSSQGRLSLDSFGESWGWKRKGEIRAWNELMFKQSRGEEIIALQTTGNKFWQASEAASKLLISDSKDQHSALFIGSKSNSACSWHPPTLWIGIGCVRNTSQTLIERSLDSALIESGLAKESIAGFATISLKSDEPSLVELFKREDWTVRFFSSSELSKVSVPNPSEAVASEVGTNSVAEASCILAAGPGSKLLFEKHIYHARDDEFGAVTIAITEAEQPFAPQRGEIHLVGSGPGEIGFLTSDARSALARTVIWIGYKLYLDLLEDLRRNDQVRIEGTLTRELDRCKLALNLAKQGAKVALISSGDCGIYGMAGLALELWLRQPQDERPPLQVHPGLSAFQIASCKSGAPFMQDFCAISLSDKLTEWEKIKNRIKSAAEGDFVIAFYNPQSTQRNWQLKDAIKILLDIRTANSPVILARQLGRYGEKLTFHTLKTIPIHEVDMLTIVIVGNSQSSIKDGYFITPRGYAIT